MKRIVKLVCLLIVFTMIISMPVHATEQTERASDFFSSYKAYCYKASTTDLRVYFSVIATGTMNTLGTSSIKVQRSSDGATWTTVRTYTKENYPQMVDSNVGFHSGYISYTATSGYYYRAYVTFYATDSSGTGKLYYYTAKI